MNDLEQKPKCPEGTVENHKGECVPRDTIITRDDLEKMKQGSKMFGDLVRKHLPSQSS